jgi:nucleoside-diphosphate-sugar epimerase
MPRAVILGGTGAIGFACARRLLRAGWTVELTGRDPAHLAPELAAAGVGFIAADRDDASSLGPVVGVGTELLVDCACKTAVHARDLVAVLGSVGCAVMISSKAVYVDAEGRHINSEAPPHFDGPIHESQPTLRPNSNPPGTREGYGPHKVAAEEVLLDSGHPVTVLRPSKVHGAWSRCPREWMFVKRILDGRPRVVLAGSGAGGDHPSAAVNIAALIETVAARPARQVLNIADPDAPRVLELVRVIAGHLGHRWEEVLLDHQPDLRDDTPHAVAGRTPWDLHPPIVLDISAALELGYEPVGTYAETVVEEIDWLVSQHRQRLGSGSGWPLPAADDPFFAPLLDYAAEDRVLAIQT